VISYLTARPSRDSIIAARQMLTRLWHESVVREQLHLSGLVIEEITQGDAQAAARRVEICKDWVPATEPEDAAHIALATLHEMDYLATWNFAHFVSPDAKYKVFLALSQWGVQTSRIRYSRRVV
jgi:hypothetical protein